jgi:hypothetical protein
VVCSALLIKQAQHQPMEQERRLVVSAAATVAFLLFGDGGRGVPESGWISLTRLSDELGHGRSSHLGDVG